VDKPRIEEPSTKNGGFGKSNLQAKNKIQFQKKTPLGTNNPKKREGGENVGSRIRNQWRQGPVWTIATLTLIKKDLMTKLKQDRKGRTFWALLNS